MNSSRWRSIAQSTQYQIFISQTRDPFLNLSIEHFLLQKTPKNSTILFLYVNRPCIVIGRNQNPWLEVNLAALRNRPAIGRNGQSTQVELVRRRSGGGTVFHDDGNLNYSVICPSSSFTRDKHAEMVASALRKTHPFARVNERHDIVLDPKHNTPDHDPPRKLSKSISMPKETPLKVSGSAYKLIRERSLHHGTCLLNSPNVNDISLYVKSPARPFLKARGVESVPSPIANVFSLSHNAPADLIMQTVKSQIAGAFLDMYDLQKIPMKVSHFGKYAVGENDTSTIHAEKSCAFENIGEELQAITEVKEGAEELKDPKWIYRQTPQFTLSTHPTEDDNRQRPPLPASLPQNTRVFVKSRGGAITEMKLDFPIMPSSDTVPSNISTLTEGKSIHEIQDFSQLMVSSPGLEDQAYSSLREIGSWLNFMFGKEREAD